VLLYLRLSTLQHLAHELLNTQLAESPQRDRLELKPSVILALYENTRVVDFRVPDQATLMRFCVVTQNLVHFFINFARLYLFQVFEVYGLPIELLIPLVARRLEDGSGSRWRPVEGIKASVTVVSRQLAKVKLAETFFDHWSFGCCAKGGLTYLASAVAGERLSAVVKYFVQTFATKNS